MRKAEKTVDATIANLTGLVEFVEDELGSAGVPERTIFDIALSVDEIVTNVIRYAYGNTTGPVTVVCQVEGDIVTITVRDHGNHFDPLSVPPADTSLPLEERGIGGLGLFLVRSLMDTVEYSRNGDENVLCLQKKVTSALQDPAPA